MLSKCAIGHISAKLHWGDGDGDSYLMQEEKPGGLVQFISKMVFLCSAVLLIFEIVAIVDVSVCVLHQQPWD